MQQHNKISTYPALCRETPHRNSYYWVDRKGYFHERVIITYVCPIDDYSSYSTDQCIIFQSNGFIKVAYDMFRELDGHDTVTGRIHTFSSIEELEKTYQIRRDLLWKETVLTKKIIRKSRYNKKYY